VTYLLDTHALLWAADDDQRLGKAARKVILDDESTLFVSVASAWELSIKVGSGRLRLLPTVIEWFTQAVNLARIQVLSVELGHLVGLETLPRHHGDPFDRLLISQARALGVTVLTSDRAFQDYDVPTMW
jgi:PIN domain nuclease of toxin-antitoxin system